MKLTEKYSIGKEPFGFSLVEKTEVKEMKDGKKTGKIKAGSKKRSHGSLYQALQDFIVLSVDDAENMFQVHLEAEEAINRINDIKEEIKKEFCIEVKKA